MTLSPDFSGAAICVRSRNLLESPLWFGFPSSSCSQTLLLMKTNPVKTALANGEPQIGTWLSLPSVFSARLMSRVGFPWLTVDLEHSPTNWETASQMFAAIADSGCVPLARVPRGDHDLIKRVLDGGAMGIVVPMINTVDEAKAAIAAAKYPPTGNRSIGGTIPALNFRATAGDYYDGANEQILVVLQTESPQGIANADEIYSLPGVDAIFVGPNDLFWQMKAADGTPPTADEFESALQAVLAAGKKAGTPVGVHAKSAEEVQQRVSEGWQFMAIKSELRMMLEQADRDVKALGLDAADDLARY